MNIGIRIAVIVAASFLSLDVASASPETTNSPTGGPLPSGVTQVGGIVLDLKGSNGTRIVSQLSASSLYQGFADFADNGPPSGSASGNPLTIGTQTGFTPAVVAALGGGLASASVRFTLFDGDSGPGDFDSGTDNTLFLNGINFGYWSDVITQQTSADGLTTIGSGTGFGDNILSTGFFSSTGFTNLEALFASLSSGSVVYSLLDADPYDNLFDFTQGIDGGSINVGTGPIVTPPMASAAPEPGIWAMMIMGFGIVGAAMRRRQKVATSLSYAV